MATFYRGYKPIIVGRTTANAKNPYKGNKVGTYSYWDNYNTDQPFDGFPDNAVQPGAGAFPGDIMMSRMFRGLREPVAYPMNAPGLGPRADGPYRFRPLEYKGLTSAIALNGGHTSRRFAFSYSKNNTTNFYSGVPSANPLFNGGHLNRYVDAPGTSNSFGRFNPSVNKGVTPVPLLAPGRTKPAVDATGVYGHEHVTEWYGIPSAKAL